MTDEEALLIEQYATHLVDFSNQYGSNESFSYTARNCLGKPDKFPSYGESKNGSLLDECKALMRVFSSFQATFPKPT